jgi:hypothetical protein
MVDPLAAAEAEGHRVVAVVTMHEQRLDRVSVRRRNAVFDAAPHAELAIEAIGCRQIVVADDAVAEATAAGGETAIHATAGIEGLAVLHVRAVEDFQRIAVAVLQPDQLEHVPICCLGLRTGLMANARVGEPFAHLFELIRSRHPKAEASQVIATVLFDDETMMPGIHPEVAAPGLALVDHLEAENLRGEVFPTAQALDTDRHVAEFGYCGHLLNLPFALADAPRKKTGKPHSPSAALIEDFISERY